MSTGRADAMRIFRKHGRFIIGCAVGSAAGLLAAALRAAPVHAVLIGIDALFLVYLLLTARIVRHGDAATLRRHAAEDDEGLLLILTLAALAVLVSVTSIALVLNADGIGIASRALALVSLPLGWATIHVLAAFHYAHLHYRGPAPGFSFPGTADPDAADFLYASFTIGMTAQVSDVEVATGPMRRAVLIHGLVSFFYNTCILALAVNAALTAGQ